MKDFHFDHVDAARETLAGRVIRTPVLPLCNKLTPYLPPDCAMFMKLELFQHTGPSARGVLLGVDWPDEDMWISGVAGFSGGNFALALAWAAQNNVPPRW